MKLVTFAYQDQERIGIVDLAGQIVDLQRAYAAYLRAAEGTPHADGLATAILGRDMVEFLRRGDKSLDAARKGVAHASANPSRGNSGTNVDRQQVRLLAPVPRPEA
jgi:hypothetical protein